MIPDDRLYLTEDEVVEMLGLQSPAQARNMGRRGEIARIPPMRPVRYLRSSVERHLEPERKEYHADHVESGWQAPAKAPAPRRRDRGTPQGSLASEAVGGGGPLHRPIGAAPRDVVVRRVESRG